MIGQQDSKRGLPQRDIAGLVQGLVVKHHQPVAGHQQQRVWRIVLEAHTARPLQPDGSLADRPVRRDLQEVRLQCPQAVEIGLDPRQVGTVLRGRLVAWQRHGVSHGQQQGGGQDNQFAAIHAPHVAPRRRVCKSAAQTSTTTYCSSTVTGTVSATYGPCTTRCPSATSTGYERTWIRSGSQYDCPVRTSNSHPCHGQRRISPLREYL